MRIFIAAVPMFPPVVCIASLEPGEELEGGDIMENMEMGNLQPLKISSRVTGWMIGIISIGLLAGCAGPSTRLPSIADPATQTWQVGTFVWFDLLTDDMKGAQAFYGDLFGWRFTVRGDVATIHQDGEAIGGIVKQKSVVPAVSESLWLPSLSVSDADAAAVQVERNGGRVLEAPADVADRGRMVVVRDPQGAPLVLLRSAGGDPGERKPEPYRWLWTDLFTTDTAAAVDFYGHLVPYVSQTLETEEGETFTLLIKGEKACAGVVRMPFKGAAPKWVPYVSVADLDTTIRRAVTSGGKLLIRVEDAAILEDPGGAAIGIQARGKDENGETS